MSIEIAFPDADRLPHVYTEREQRLFAEELLAMQEYITQRTEGLCLTAGTLDADREDLASYFRSIRASIADDFANASYARWWQLVELVSPGIFGIESEEEGGNYDITPLARHSRVSGRIVGMQLGLYPETVKSSEEQRRESTHDDDGDTKLVASVVVLLREAKIRDVNAKTGDTVRELELDDGTIEIPLCYGCDALKMKLKPVEHFAHEVDLSVPENDSFPHELVGAAATTILDLDADRI